MDIPNSWIRMDKGFTLPSVDQQRVKTEKSMPHFAGALARVDEQRIQVLKLELPYQ